MKIPKLHSMHILSQTILTQLCLCRGHFRGMKAFDLFGCEALLEWTGNYTTFFDNLFQLQLLGCDTRLLYVPTHINKFTVLPIQHQQIVKSLEKQGESTIIPAYYNRDNGVLR